MKLARPDVFHPRIVLAGCPKLVQGDGDDAGLIAALRSRGLHARWLSWDDPAALDSDLVVLRATWDYTNRLDEFLSWTARVPNLLNSPAVVAWNTDKRYLHDLAVAGVPVLETEFFAPGDIVHLPGGEVVVKPVVGAGAVGAQRFTDHNLARDHAASLQDAGSAVMVQPYDPRVEAGETALVFVGGEQSHAFTKGPILPESGEAPALDSSETYAEELLGPAEPDEQLWEIGRHALDATAGHLGMACSDLLYARVDLIGDGADGRLLEVELVEPGLGWGQLDDRTRDRQQRRFALAVESALSRLGLGPLSHRRP